MANAWTTAETNVFTHINTALGNTLNTTAFIGEYPPSIADASVDYVWYFAIQGGGQIDQTPAGVNYCGMMADAELRGVFESRETAQSHAITVRNLLPAAADAITGVRDLRLTSEPRIERAVWKRKADQSNAGEVRVWELVIEMQCIIG